MTPEQVVTEALKSYGLIHRICSDFGAAIATSDHHVTVRVVEEASSSSSFGSV